MPPIRSSGAVGAPLARRVRPDDRAAHTRGAVGSRLRGDSDRSPTVDYDMVRLASALVVDTRNAIAGEHAHVLKLGAPAPAVREPLAANAA